MHNAPAVSHPVGRSVFHGLCVGALLVIVSGVGVLWWRQGGRWEMPEWSAALTGLLAGGWSLASWWRSPTGMLQWDGGAWRWLASGKELPGRVETRLDWQQGLLLEFQPLAGPSCWCWMERRRDPASWDALRRAACARAGAEMPGAGQGAA